MNANKPWDSAGNRMRIVIACDHCRSRKVKCEIQDDNSKCDACIRRKVDCTHDARSKSYNELEKVIATHISGGSGGIASTTSSFGGNSSIISFSPVPSTSDSDIGSHASTAPNSDSSYPPVALMPYFIELFFKHHAITFPFMSYECVVAEYLQSKLSAVISNGIACIGSKYSAELTELSSLDSPTVSEYYAEQTKSLLQEMSSSPSVDGLVASVLIAFHEHISGRSDGLKVYAQKSAHIAQAIGLYDDAMIATMGYPAEEFPRVIPLRDSVFQMYELAMSRGSE